MLYVNIELLNENSDRITMAVAGFSMDELEITSEGEKLIVKGIKPDQTTERTFQLADHVKVIGANLDNGLLDIDLERDVPEALKPIKISIGQTREVEEQLVNATVKAKK